MKLSLRFSLTAWFVGLVAIIALVGSTGLYFVARNAMIQGLDARLLAQAQGVASLCEYDDGAIHLEGYYEIDGHLPLLEGDHGFEVRLQPAGEIQVRSGRQLPPPLPDHESGGRDQGNLRVVAIHVDFPAREERTGADPEPASPGFTVLVRTAASLDPIEYQLGRIRWSIVLGVAGSLATAVAFALFLSRRVTRPLAQLGDAATRLSEGQVLALPRSGNGDEIDRLAVLLDHAFERVRASVVQQRRFVADASHELRNPVAIVASVAEIGLRHPRTVAEYREMLAEIESVARHMTQILTSLLEMARLDESGRLSGSKLDLAKVVSEARAGLESERAVAMHVVPAPVAGDAVLLAVLCRNLLENAVRHAVSGVEVRVGIDHNRVVLRVSDDGPGVSENERDRIFDRFFRGENAKGTGSGLGLALVRSIARAHGGDCRIEPSPIGLTVLVELPTWAG